MSTRAVGGVHRSRSRVLCRLHAQAHTAAPQLGRKRKDLISLYTCGSAAASTRSLHGDRASGARETRIPPPDVSSSACSRKKRELKRPAAAFVLLGQITVLCFFSGDVLRGISTASVFFVKDLSAEHSRVPVHSIVHRLLPGSEPAAQYHTFPCRYTVT